MPIKSKENNLLELFFNYPTKHWHFEEILRQSGLSRDKANKWLKRFMKEKLIKRVKKKMEMPYYTGNHEHPSYRNRKKLYALTQFYESGFLDHLQSLKKAKTVILFGSMARSDWYSESDIDVFIYGKSDEFDRYKFQSKLKREIQLFTADSKKELRKMGSGLLKNIVCGNFIKGKLDFIGVSLNG
ncbi:nucleotidyltransferase domain-containing protein [Candidatus Woesearchaeota archaeon]|nr:nucleotidyltransferase domain-containing protein [Candidatus Woesearchaeota archaeon]